MSGSHLIARSAMLPHSLVKGVEFSKSGWRATEYRHSLLFARHFGIFEPVGAAGDNSSSSKHAEQKSSTVSSASPSSKPTSICSWPGSDDVVLDSLEETLDAHRNRSIQLQQWLGQGNRTKSMENMNGSERSVIRYVPDAGKVPSLSSRNMKPHWASFEDFRSLHDVNQKNLAPLFKLQEPHLLQRHADRSKSHKNDFNSRKEAISGQIPRIKDQDYDAMGMKPRPPAQRSMARRDFSIGKPQAPRAVFGGSESSLPSSVRQVQDGVNLYAKSEDSLSYAMIEFNRYMTLTQEEIDTVHKAVQQLAKIAQTAFPSHALVLHGSHATGLATPSSVIDLNLQSLEEEGLPPIQNTRQRPLRQKHNEQRSQLEALRLAIRSFDITVELNTKDIRRPLLIIKDHNGWTCQVSSGRHVHSRTQIVGSLLEEYASLRPIYILLRHCLYIRGLCNPRYGGVGSYPLIVMVVTALKHTNATGSIDGLAKQFIAVLDFWTNADLSNTGYTLNPALEFPKFGGLPRTSDQNEDSELLQLDASAHAVDVRKSSEVAVDPARDGIAVLQSENAFVRSRYERDKRNLQGPWLLSLQDPAESTNDLGRNSYRILDVIETLRRCKRSLVTQMQSWDNSSSEERQKQQLHPLRPFIHSDLGRVEKRRTSLRKSTFAGFRRLKYD